jgi:hypothetical protein
MLLGVDLKVAIEYVTHFSISTSGKSENNKIHSLKPEFSNRSLSWVKTDSPMCNGNDESPSSSLSQRWRIL